MKTRLPVMLTALLFASACHDAPDHGTIDAGACIAPDAQACLGAARLDISFCKGVSIEATPASTFVGRLVSLRAETDQPAESLTATWTAAPDGEFMQSEAGMTHYRCTSQGAKKLQVIVADGRGCSSQSQVEIDCVAAP